MHALVGVILAIAAVGFFVAMHRKAPGGKAEQRLYSHTDRAQNFRRYALGALYGAFGSGCLLALSLMFGREHLGAVWSEYLSVLLGLLTATMLFFWVASMLGAQYARNTTERRT